MVRRRRTCRIRTHPPPSSAQRVSPPSVEAKISEEGQSSGSVLPVGGGPCSGSDGSMGVRMAAEGQISISDDSIDMQPVVNRFPEMFLCGNYKDFNPFQITVSTGSQKCLFKSELVHPAFDDGPQQNLLSPPDLSPITKQSPLQLVPILEGSNTDKSGPVTVITIEPKEDRKGKGKKRIADSSSSRSVESPRPKRGRPAAVADKKD